MRKRGGSGGIEDGRWKKSPSTVQSALLPSPSQTSLAINGRGKNTQGTHDTYRRTNTRRPPCPKYGKGQHPPAE